MSYIPPHKRNSNETEGWGLTPDRLAPLFARNVNRKSSDKGRSSKLYAGRSVRKWWAVGINDDTQFPSSITLKVVEDKCGKRSIALMNCEGSEVKWDLPKSPWVYIAENVAEDLLAFFENVRNEMKASKLEEVEPTLVAQVGTVLFRWRPSVNLEALRENLTTEVLKKWKRRTFTPYVPVSYKEKIVNEVVPNIGVEFESDKEIYEVELDDSTRPDVYLSCKCSVKKDGKLQLYKVELNQRRNMVMDISILVKNLDLSLMLTMKRTLTTQTDDEMQCIRYLIDSAIIDPDVKGKLRWPLEKTSSGKYSVTGICHIRSKAYKNQSLRFKVSHVDIFDFKIAYGEASWEITLSLKKIVEKLKEENVEVGSISEMLEENMKFIWENFLSCDNLFK